MRHRMVAILMAHSGPRMVALGAAVGVFAAVLPLPFLQVLIALLLATVLGANRLAALTTVWVANPVFFYADYVVGGRLLSALAPDLTPDVQMTWSDFLSHMRDSFFTLLRAVLLPMAAGSVPLGVLAGSLTYLVVLRIVTYYRGRLNA